MGEDGRGPPAPCSINRALSEQGNSKVVAKPSFGCEDGPAVVLTLRPEAVDWAGAGAGGTLLRRALFERLSNGARVTELSAPPGSGKTELLRSWLREAGLDGRAAWVTVQPRECSPQFFWVLVTEALRATTWGAGMVRLLSVAPGLDGYDAVERLLEDLGALRERAWLVVDDLHELGSSEALRQFELFVARAPKVLRFVISTRRDLHIGLHRLRLAGELTEIRAADLAFGLEEARRLFLAVGARVPEAVLESLVEKTEGWAAGLRLAALSLATHPDPERFAAEFSGSERTIAEYLLAEVLESQPLETKRLLLRTSVLDKVNGELADLLTGGSGGERTLQELEEAGAFVTSIDGRRSWFRYHQLFADLLRLELRRAEPGAERALNRLAAEWFAAHGQPLEAVRHAQEAAAWALAARLLSDHWLGLTLKGQGAAARELLEAFPAGVVAADGELLALRVADTMTWWSLEEAHRDLALACHRAESVPKERRPHFHLFVATTRLSLAGRRGDLETALKEAGQLLSAASSDNRPPCPEGDLRAMTLVGLGTALAWTSQTDEAARHLAQGAALARHAGYAYLELTALAHLAVTAAARSLSAGEQRGLRAVEFAEQHGWGNEQPVGVAYLALAMTTLWQGRLDHAEEWLERAERVLRPEVEPSAGVSLYQARALWESVRGHDKRAFAALEDADGLRELLVTPHPLVTGTHALLLETLVRAGETEQAERILEEVGEKERESGQVRTALAALSLAEGDPAAASAWLAPVLDGAARATSPWLGLAYLIEAAARDGPDSSSSGPALERALDLAERDGALLPFLLHPLPELLERHRRQTSHAALVSEILAMVAGTKRREASQHGQEADFEPLSESEARILRYLPTNLSAPEIANDLYISVNTVKTHLRHLYAKLGVNRRSEAVERARALGLLAPPWHHA